MDETSLQLLKVMREQLGETTGRTVDAVAAAKSLGMYPGTLERSLLYLVRAGYIEEYADRACGLAGRDVSDYPAGYSCDRQRLAPVPSDTPIESSAEAREGAQRPWWRRVLRKIGGACTTIRL